MKKNLSRLEMDTMLFEDIGRVFYEGLSINNKEKFDNLAGDDFEAELKKWGILYSDHAFISNTEELEDNITFDEYFEFVFSVMDDFTKR